MVVAELWRDAARALAAGWERDLGPMGPAGRCRWARVHPDPTGDLAIATSLE